MGYKSFAFSPLNISNSLIFRKLIVNPLIKKKITEVSPLKKGVNGLTEVVPNYGIKSSS